MRPSVRVSRGLAATLPTTPRALNLEPKCFGDVLQCVRDVAGAMGHPDRADEVCRGMEGRVADVVRRVAGLARPTVFVMEWADPIYNAGHWTPELVRLAGGTPVLALDLRVLGPRSVGRICGRQTRKYW